jgi:hypothetical protein
MSSVRQQTESDFSSRRVHDTPWHYELEFCLLYRGRLPSKLLLKALSRDDQSDHLDREDILQLPRGL